MDTGIWRRLIVIPFEQTITPSVDIKNYADHLYEKDGYPRRRTARGRLVDGLALISEFAL